MDSNLSRKEQALLWKNRIKEEFTMVKMPKLFNKRDITGLALAAGVGGITGLLYMAGKLSGRADAYEHCGQMIKEMAKAVTEEKPNN